ncbi:MAG: ABC transporter substrate-binding protein [Clostridia bacterium]|nr:ABC transporter substrate-binding protein [Clostridia bacterium]
MKSKFLKYIFVIIVIVLVIYSVYIIYGKKDNNENNYDTAKVSKEEEIIDNIRIPIVNFDTINPILSNNAQVQNISKLIYEPLLTITEDYKIELCLAKEWSKVTNTSYVIKLKDNIKWNDGTLFTAKDVQFTIDRLKDSKVKSIYAYNVENVTGIEVIDNATIRINLDKEVPFFEYNLTFPIMSYKYYENEDFVNTYKNSNPIGTGKFKVVSDNGNVILKLNENWWNVEEKDCKLSQIQIIKYGNMGEVYKAFKIGNIDLINTDSLDIQNYIGTIGYNLKSFKGRELDYLAFNCNNEELSNKEIRQAISYAIDKQNIVSAIYGDKYYVANFPLDYGNYLYEQEKVGYEYNMDKAKELLIRKGWEFKNKTWQKVKDYRTLRLNFNLVVNSSNGKRVEVAENIKNSLEILGIKVNIIKANDATYKRYLENRNYDMILTGKYTAFSPDLSTYFGEANLANYNSETAKQILNDVNNIREEKTLKEKYNNLVDIYKEDIPYIYLYWNRSSLICSSKLMGDIKPNRYNLFYKINTWYRQ